MADVALPGRSRLLPGCRLRRGGVVEPSADHRGGVAAELGASSAGPRTRDLRRCMSHWCRSLCAVATRSGGRAPHWSMRAGRWRCTMVPRRLSGSGFAHADCDCGTTPLGTSDSCVAGGGPGGCRRCLVSRPCAASGLAELSAVLDAALPTRNSLAEGVFSGVAARSACRRVGLRAWLLIWLGPYPVSMIGVPGQAVQNT